MADRQRETETAQVPEAPPTHRPSQPRDPQPEHNQRHPTRLTHPQDTSQTLTQKQRRPMRRPSIPLKTKLQPHSHERPYANHQTETKHNHTKTRQPTMARHDHPMAGRPNHIPETIPPTKQSRIRLQRPETMLRKPSIQPQENSPETRTPPQNPQLQHRNRQPNNHQARKQITFHSPHKENE
jgi:hypothetical protein